MGKLGQLGTTGQAVELLLSKSHWKHRAGMMSRLRVEAWGVSLSLCLQQAALCLPLRHDGTNEARIPLFFVLPTVIPHGKNLPHPFWTVGCISRNYLVPCLEPTSNITSDCQRDLAVFEMGFSVEKRNSQLGSTRELGFRGQGAHLDEKEKCVTQRPP